MDNYRPPEMATSPSEARSKAVDDGIFTSVEVSDNNKKDRALTSKMLTDMHRDINKSVSGENSVESISEYFVVIEKSFKHNKKYSDYFGIPPSILAGKMTVLMLYQMFASSMKEDSGVIAPIITTPFSKNQGDEDTSLEIHMSVAKSDQSSKIVELAHRIVNEISSMVTDLIKPYGYSLSYDDSIQMNNNSNERFEA